MLGPYFQNGSRLWEPHFTLSPLYLFTFHWPASILGHPWKPRAGWARHWFKGSTSIPGNSWWNSVHFIESEQAPGRSLSWPPHTEEESRPQNGLPDALSSALPMELGELYWMKMRCLPISRTLERAPPWWEREQSRKNTDPHGNCKLAMWNADGAVVPQLRNSTNWFQNSKIRKMLQHFKNWGYLGFLRKQLLLKTISL